LADKKAMRSVGHALQAKVHSQKRICEVYLQEVDIYTRLFRDLRRPPLSTRYKIKNLDRYRGHTDERIHEAAETAAINLDMRTTAIHGMHKAIKSNLYTGNHSVAEFSEQWQKYLVMIGKYTRARLLKVQLSQDATNKELQHYLPYLEDNSSLAVAV
jgi:hypothetical protein